MGISANIRAYRADRGWTQEQLAEKLDVARSTITQWETGWSKPRMGMVAKLADAFGVSMSDIVADDVKIKYSLVMLDDISKDEYRLIELYRNMDTRARKDLLKIAETLS